MDMGGIGKVLCAQGKAKESLPYFDKAVEFDPKNPLFLCNRAKAYRQLGQDDLMLIDVKKVSLLIENGEFGDLASGIIDDIKSAIKDLLLVEQAMKETEQKISALDENNSIAQVIIQQFELLKTEKTTVTTKIINNLADKDKGEFASMQNQIDNLKQELKQLNQRIANIEVSLEDLKKEIDQKMSDYNKMLDTKLEQDQVPLADQIKIQGYFNAFVETFSSVHVTSQVIDSGQVKLDTDDARTTFLSTIASFAPFCWILCFRSCKVYR